MQALEGRFKEEVQRASDLMDANQALASEVENMKQTNAALKDENDQVHASLQEIDVQGISCFDTKGAVCKLQSEWKKKVIILQSATC